MKTAKNKKLKFYLLGIVIFIGSIYLFFNQKGIIKYLKLKYEVKTLQMQIDSVDNANQHIQGEIDSLKSKAPAKIEKIAREKYGMIRKGETVIKVHEK